MIKISKEQYRKLWVLGGLVLAIGLGFIIYSYIKNPVNIVGRAIENNEIQLPFKGNRSAIYLVKHVNKNCLPCLKLDLLRKDPRVKIIFYVDRDFSDIDIGNFKKTFNIPDKYPVKRIPDDWMFLAQKCNKQNRFEGNLLVLVNENNIVKKVWRF